MATLKHTRCSSAGRVTAHLLLSFLAISPVSAHDASRHLVSSEQFPILPPIAAVTPMHLTHSKQKRFSLRNIYHHGTYLHPEMCRRKDVLDLDAPLWLEADDGRVPALPLVVKTRPERIHRLADRRPQIVDSMVAAAHQYGFLDTLSATDWSLDDILGPNITDKDTIVALAQMSADAYVEEPHTGDWFDIGRRYNTSLDFGWESDGIRGHVFSDESNSTIIISIKGTSMAIYDGAETTTNDKENDNLFFSCCCGQQGSITHRRVCDCASSTYSCNDTCVSNALTRENRYYAASRHLFSNVTSLYPDAEVWLTGHSLGGAVASFLGLTYGLPTVTFEAPPDALAASRLGLPAPPGSERGRPQTRQYTGIYHFGHTADPLYLGTCTGASSLCSFAGYAMESSCHAGMECVYDVVADKGWRVGLGTHKIKSVIRDVLLTYDTVPECRATPECFDCPLWKRYQSNSSEPTTSFSSSSTYQRTRTATCQTPGWWGCLDESTTTAPSSPTSIPPITPTPTTTTTTCRSPGWFGCRDEITTTSHISGPRRPTATKTTTTCTHPGFWGGCNDPSPPFPTSTTRSHTSHATTTSHFITAPPGTFMPTSTIHASEDPSTTTLTTTTTCTRREWFGLICVDPSPEAVGFEAALKTQGPVMDMPGPVPYVEM